MVHVVLGGDGLAGFAPLAFTDSYVNVAIPPPDATYGAPFDIDAIRDTLPEEQWPARRRYTVRAWKEGERLLTIDFVVHGDQGVAGAWAYSVLSLGKKLIRGVLSTWQFRRNRRSGVLSFTGLDHKALP